MVNTFDNLPEGKKLYFASDFHLGAPDYESSLLRERKIISWLDEIKGNAGGIFLVGDIFDFWFEYNQTVPKGFIRFLGKLAEITDAGIPIVVFTGNHDMWMFDYFPHHLNIEVYKSVKTFKVGGIKIHIGHGDGLGPGDHAYKFYKKIFSNSLCQKMFEWLHPNIGIWIARYWSNKSRMSGDHSAMSYEAEWLIQYCREVEAKDHHDYYIFGHRHIATELQINDDSKYINLGEWLDHCTYAVYENGQMVLRKYT